MEELKALIQQVDDDYLIGLSNKGTLKRALKDLEQETPSFTWEEGAARVALKEETCVIRAPLGESSCSCPSRSVCRHIITAVLFLKRELAGSSVEESTGSERHPAQEEGNGSAVQGGQPDASDSTGAAQSAAQTKPGQAAQAGEKTAQEGAEVIEKSQGNPPVMEELLQQPVERLKRACGAARFRKLLSHLQTGEMPPIAESSIITVQLPWEPATVKLLSPLQYSTCSCHSKELCAHKAMAILAYQVKKGAVSTAQLSAMLDTEITWDEEQIQQACFAVKEALQQQMNTGLSRQSPEEAESLERLAVISHRAGLAELESGLRAASAEYVQYFNRSAAFRAEGLQRKLFSLYERACRLEDACRSKEAGKAETLRRLAGTFRDAYEPVGSLQLIGVGASSFLSKSGYEGETYYFFETKRRAWYTWTDARPVFYEGTRRRPLASYEEMPAPWGLNCKRANLVGLEFTLKGAKAAAGGRLSASQETTSEIFGTHGLQDAAIAGQIVWNYRTLMEQYRIQPLALISAAGWKEPDFDQVQQRFFWELRDVGGRKLFVSIQYSEREKLTIQMLERLAKRLKNGSFRSLVFFGRLYLSEGRLCLYPIECFPQEPAKVPKLSDETPTAPAKGEAVACEILDGMERYAAEVQRQLSDLFVSGLSSLSEETARRLQALAQDGEQMGLSGAAKELSFASEELSRRRHQMSFDSGRMIASLARLSRRLSAYSEKLSYDRALLVMESECAMIEDEHTIEDKEEIAP